MPYTLTMGLIWFAAAFVLGVGVGIVLRSVTARRQVERARAEVRTTPAAAARIAALEGELATVRRNASGSVEPGDAPVPDDGDDLTRVIGLAPQVAELCHGIGIRTYAELADTEVSLLRTLLDDAGPRLRVHDPSTWPGQARLLADGRDTDFEAMADTLRSGPAAEQG